MTFSSRRRATGLVLAALLGLGSLVAACGGDDKGASSTTTAGRSEDYEAPMSEVLGSLPRILVAAEAADLAAQAGKFDSVNARYDELHQLWAQVEGTVKATDPDSYESIEAAQGLIKDGGETEDAERVSAGVADQSEAINAFIAENS